MRAANSPLLHSASLTARKLPRLIVVVSVSQRNFQGHAVRAIISNLIHWATGRSCRFNIQFQSAYPCISKFEAIPLIVASYITSVVKMPSCPTAGISANVRIHNDFHKWVGSWHIQTSTNYLFCHCQSLPNCVHLHDP